MVASNIRILEMRYIFSGLAKSCRVRLKPDGTRWRTGGEVKGKLADGVGSQYSHSTSERGVSSINNTDVHTSAVSSRLNWRPRRFKWTRPFRRKTKSGFCASAITFQTQSTATAPYASIQHRDKLTFMYVCCYFALYSVHEIRTCTYFCYICSYTKLLIFDKWKNGVSLYYCIFIFARSITSPAQTRGWYMAFRTYKLKQDRQCTYNVTLKRLHATIPAVKEQ
jgi:hypothetical protein